MAARAEGVPQAFTYPLNLLECAAAAAASVRIWDGGRFPNAVGSPSDNGTAGNSWAKKVGRGIYRVRKNRKMAKLYL